MLKRLIVICLISIVCISCDRITKLQAVKHLSTRAPISFWGDTVRLQYAENTGGMLSLGGSLAAETRFYLFSLVVGLFLFGMVLFVIFRSLDRSMILSCALIIGGGVGNLLDRLMNQGRVVDFMNLGIGSLRTGIFNMADLFIMGGVFWMLLVTWQQQDLSRPSGRKGL